MFKLRRQKYEVVFYCIGSPPRNFSWIRDCGDGGYHLKDRWSTRAEAEKVVAELCACYQRQKLPDGVYPNFQAHIKELDAQAPGANQGVQLYVSAEGWAALETAERIHLRTDDTPNVIFSKSAGVSDGKFVFPRPYPENGWSVLPVFLNDERLQELVDYLRTLYTSEEWILPMQ